MLTLLAPYMLLRFAVSRKSGLITKLHYGAHNHPFNSSSINQLVRPVVRTAGEKQRPADVWLSLQGACKLSHY